MIDTFGCHSRHEYGTEGLGGGAGGSGTEERWTSICGAELEKERMEETCTDTRTSCVRLINDGTQVKRPDVFFL